MLKRVFTVGLLAGLTAGLATAALQHVTTVPLILEAERYEASLGAAPALAGAEILSAIATHGPDSAATADGHSHDATAWSPTDGLERTLSTSVATAVSGIGFALLLIAVLLLAGERITPRVALAYAVGGFAATGLATGLGLAPELPGSFAAPLQDRQAWWIGTAIATAAGLYLVVKAPHRLALPAGVVLLALPHLIGAPHPDGYGSTVPAEIAAHFAATSLVVHGVFWAIVGLAVGVFWQRGESRAAT